MLVRQFRRVRPERRDVAEYDAGIGRLRERRRHRRVVSARDDVVVVQEVHDLAFGALPTQVAYDRRPSPGRHRVSQIAHARVADGRDRVGRGAVRTIVDDEHLDADAFLAERARDRLAQLGRAPKRGDDDRDVERHDRRRRRQARRTGSAARLACGLLESRSRNTAISRRA